MSSGAEEIHRFWARMLHRTRALWRGRAACESASQVGRGNCTHSLHSLAGIDLKGGHLSDLMGSDYDPLTAPARERH
jgi:hypothetical protein